jgi:hypothetical protein
MTSQKDNKDAGGKPVSPPEQHSKMAVPRKSEPGLELDAHGNPIPLEQRTRDDQERAKAARKS